MSLVKVSSEIATGGFGSGARVRLVVRGEDLGSSVVSALNDSSS